MATIKPLRAKENNLPNYKDGQLIFTERGNAYIDFPNNQRIKINDGARHSLLDKINPNILNIGYSTNLGGWKTNLKLEGNTVDNHILYLNQPEINVWKTNEKIFHYTGKISKLTLNVQSLNNTDYPGTFAFDNFELLPILNTNSNFTQGIGNWEMQEDKTSIVDDSTNSNRGKIFKVHGANNNKERMLFGITVPDNVELLETKEYKLYFKVYCYANANNPAFFITGNKQITLKDFKGPTLDSSQTVDSSSSFLYRCNLNNKTNQWHEIEITLSGLSNANIHELGFLNYRAGAGNYYFSDVCLLDGTNYIQNPNFDFNILNWTSEEYYYPYQLNSIPLDGNSNIALTTNLNNPLISKNAETFIKQTRNNIGPSPSEDYIFRVTSNRLENSYLWQNYITIMENDKYAFLNENHPLLEKPKLGGPWATVLEPHYSARFELKKSNLAKMNISGFEIQTIINASNKYSVFIETQKNNYKPIRIASFDFDKQEDQDIQLNFLPCEIQDLDYDNIFIVVALNGDVDTSKKDNYLLKIKAFGEHLQTPEKNNNSLFYEDYYGVFHCKEIKADSYKGVIDDGSLSWEDIEI